MVQTANSGRENVHEMKLAKSISEELAREFRLYIDFDILTGPLELSCVEMGDIVCTCAYMQFDVIYVHFPHMKNLKCIFFNVKINSESIGGIVFPA